MEISEIEFDLGPIKKRPFDTDILAALERLPKGILDLFVDGLHDGLDGSAFKFAPATNVCTAKLALDPTTVRRVVRSLNDGAAAFPTGECGRNLVTGHETITLIANSTAV